MASASIKGKREEYPGKTDKEICEIIAKNEAGIKTIVRYKQFSGGEYTTFGLCYSDQDLQNYYDSPACQEVEVIFRR